VCFQCPPHIILPLGEQTVQIKRCPDWETDARDLTGAAAVLEALHEGRGAVVALLGRVRDRDGRVTREYALHGVIEADGLADQPACALENQGALRSLLWLLIPGDAATADAGSS